MTAEEWCDLFHAEQRVSEQLRKENMHLQEQITDLKNLVKEWTNTMESLGRALKTYHDS